MWSYYDLIAAERQVDRIRSAGYQVSPAAELEVTPEAIAQHFNQQHQSDVEERQAARRTALAALVNAVKVLFRNRTAIAR